jgi:kynurenine formamidase
MIIDLTHQLKNKLPVFPGTIEPSFVQANTVEKDGFAELNMTMSTHTGTHVDAPCHIIANGKSLDQLPLEKFIGKAIVIDCTQVTSISMEIISLEFLQSEEDKIKQVEFILFYTGWQQKWDTPDYLEDFPTLTQEAAEWLLKFPLKGLGFDAISVDRVSDFALPNHHLLLGHEILIIENLINIDQLTDQFFEFNCIPLHIENSDASPVRAFARIND